EHDVPLRIHIEAALSMHPVGLFDASVVLRRREQAHHLGAAQDQRLAMTPTLRRYLTTAAHRSSLRPGCASLLARIAPREVVRDVVEGREFHAGMPADVIEQTLEHQQHL